MIWSNLLIKKNEQNFQLEHYVKKKLYTLSSNLGLLCVMTVTQICLHTEQLSEFGWTNGSGLWFSVMRSAAFISYNKSITGLAKALADDYAYLSAKVKSHEKHMSLESKIQVKCYKLSKTTRFSFTFLWEILFFIGVTCKVF